MADLADLLSFPQTSNGFTALRPIVVADVVDDQSESPARKTPRLDADSDSGSASRSRDRLRDRSLASDGIGPLVVEIQGLSVQTSNDKFYDALFLTLGHAISIVLARDGSGSLPAPYETIYNACRSTVCVSQRGEDVYEKLKLELERCTGRLARDLTEEKDTWAGDAVAWLESFVQTCEWFEGQVALLHSLLTYLDRGYIVTDRKLSSVRDLSYSLFLHRVLCNAVIVGKLHSAIEEWSLYEREKKAEHPRRSVIQGLVKHLVTHGQYTTVLETPYIELTHAFYVGEAKRVVDEAGISAADFLQLCRERLDEERARAKATLRRETVEVVVDTARRALLEGRLKWLAKEAMGPLMASKNTARLAMMYAHFSAVDGLKVLCAEFKACVQKTVEGVVKDSARDDEMVDRLLDFKSFADMAVTTSFAHPPIPLPASSSSSSPPHDTDIDMDIKPSDLPAIPKHPNQEFAYAVIDSFSQGFKARRNKPAEQIARHVDRLMRRGQQALSDTEFDGLLDAALALYRFTNDKDVFRAFYHRALAKRLLLARSASDDFEKAMLKKLKEKYDPEFGMCDQMFTDLTLSRDLMGEFHARGDEEADSRTSKLNVMVLQRSVWPFAARKTDVDLPLDMQAPLTAFTAFYKSRHQGHKLDWDHALGTATVTARFPKGTKELSVSLYQAVVLLLFNEVEGNAKETETGFRQIKESTRMDDAELRRTLQSLACGQKKVLKKRPVGRDVNDDDVFVVNTEFTDLRARVHINAIQAKETPEESQRTQTSIEGDRKHYLDAAIVRIMKARRTLTYEALKVQTVEAVKAHFVPDVPLIKARIAGLVEQEYLRRDEEDMNLYVYVA